MLIKVFSLLFCLTTLLSSGPSKSYSKNYNDQGQMVSEGWMMGTMKTNYWRFYHSNGQLASKGHFKNNLESGYWYFYNKEGQITKEGHYDQGIAENWWIFHDLAQQQTLKIQHQNNQKNGYGLVYKKNKLVKVIKYLSDIEKGTWTDLKSFRRDNPDVSLY